MHIFHTSLFLNSFSLFSSLYRLLHFNCDSVCRTLPLELGRLSFDVLVIHCPWFWPFMFPGHPHNIDRQPLSEIHYQSSVRHFKIFFELWCHQDCWTHHWHYISTGGDLRHRCSFCYTKVIFTATVWKEHIIGIWLFILFAFKRNKL